MDWSGVRVLVSCCGARPRTRSMSAEVIMPGRRIVGSEDTRETTVDSTPVVHSPPSRTRGILPPSSCMTEAASVGEIRPKRLALGAARGSPTMARSCCATGWAGYRSATVSRPAVTSSGTFGPRWSTIVRGPGQKAEARRKASAGTFLGRIPM